MSRLVAGALETHLANGSSNLCHAIQITRKDGAIERYTDAVADATVSGNTYTSHPSMTFGSIPYGLDGFSSGFDIEFGAGPDELITTDDIRAHVYDAAEVELREFDELHPEYGAVYLFWGRVATIVRDVQGRVKLSAKGLLAQSHQIIVDRYMPMCIWFFCDDRCGVDAATYTFTGTITAIPDPYTLTVSGAIASRPDDVFKDGVYEITSGLRAGVWGIELRGNSGSTLKTFLAHPHGLAVGDTISALQGCGKRREDCKAYNNYDRFGGFPDAGSPAEAANISYRDWSA